MYMCARGKQMQKFIPLAHIYMTAHSPDLVPLAHIYMTAHSPGLVPLEFWNCSDGVVFFLNI
jgi:hypothetical protein